MSTLRILLLIPVGLLGCAHYPFNEPLSSFESTQGYRFRNLSSPGNSDKTFIVLTFSGGGTRAAALSYGVLQQLKHTHVLIDGKERTLLDEVDVISSVSGGSFTAAYYALFGDEIFESYENDFLKQDVEEALLNKLFLNLLRLLSPTFSRIDIAAEYYDARIFQHKTFGHLLAQGQRPFLIINATDMTSGATFEFTQDQFDLLYSDLATFPVARAVAASSAFPVLFTPVTLRNYAKADDCGEPDWIELGLEDRDVASRRFQKAQQAESYLDESERPYVHLLDGGIADNLGTRIPLHALTTTDNPWSLLRMINLEKIERIVFVIVNAKTQPDTKWDERETTPSPKEMLGATIEGLQANYTFDSAVLVAEEFEQLEQAVKVRNDCEALLKEHCPKVELPDSGLPEVEYYFIPVSFDLIAEDERREFFQDLPTRLTVPEKDVDKLIDVGAELLRNSREFQRLVAGLDGQIEAPRQSPAILN